MITYEVKYPVSFGAMCIHEETYTCKALCKYHAYLKFIEDTKDEWHYSDRSKRTIYTYDEWKDDISRKGE